MISPPRPEYPRPNLRRNPWLNLNGVWDFAFDPQAIGEQRRWYRPEQPKDLSITVPFPWESPLSGVAAPQTKGAAWYQRQITIPADWEGLHPILHFGAVDWLARVWVNGRFVAEHENGYLPFAVDLHQYARPGETVTVTVRAYDIADATTLVGKQVPAWYTHSSGIWQTVWLEGRPANHISAIRVEPNADLTGATLILTVDIADDGPFTYRVSSRDDSFAILQGSEQFGPGVHQLSLSVTIRQPRLWTPETPHLYEFGVELVGEDAMPDQIYSYFGLRSIGRGVWGDHEHETILLNGEPVYLRGALDQAFHPDGIHAYPSDDVIRGDIQLAKDLGLNMLRCHIKINDPRYYYWADKLGLLIMYDFPSPDLDTPTMRRIFLETLHQAMERDFNSPSIMAWVLFNETWGLTGHTTLEGQQWLQEMVRLARQLDPTRLIEDNSPCLYDHVETDINSWHYYINDYEQVRRHVQQVVDQTYPGSPFNYVGGKYVQSTAPLMNSEYGGIAARMGDQDISWCFKYQTSELRRHAKICGYVYTELDDIEWEHNGFVNYDRSPKSFGYEGFVPGMSVADLNSPDFVGADAPPCQTVAPGSQVAVPLFVSHWGPFMGSAEVHWELTFMDRFGRPSTAQKGVIPVTPRRFDVTLLPALELALPSENGLVTLALWLQDAAGGVRCRNYIQWEISGALHPASAAAPEGWGLGFRPGDFSATSWPRYFVGPEASKFSAPGAGWVEYEVKLPPEVAINRLHGLTFHAEIAGRAGRGKIDWPQSINGENYPQTDPKKRTPTQIQFTINGVLVGSVLLEDDPADAQGVLSHHRQIDPGAYGYLTKIQLSAQALEEVKATLGTETRLRIRLTVDGAGPAGGISLYGESLGRYPVRPTLLCQLG